MEWLEKIDGWWAWAIWMSLGLILALLLSINHGRRIRTLEQLKGDVRQHNSPMTNYLKRIFTDVPTTIVLVVGFAIGIVMIWLAWHGY